MKRKKGGGGGANWMDTYGDMVTLLLCFFIMLYSMSTINEEKWQQFVQSFQRQPSSEAVGMGGQDKVETTEQDVQEALTQIAAALNEYSAENNLQQQMTVTQGADYVFITFQNAVFFAGDSWELLDSGKRMLDEVAKAIQPQSKLIDELRVMGHTSQGSPDKANDPTVDRFLASNRAATVTVYLQNKNVVDADKLVSVGYGQWRPIDGFDTEEERAHNRRVELMVTGLDPGSAENSVEKCFTMREGALEE